MPAYAVGSGVVHVFFFVQAEDGIRVLCVTGVQTCALPISDTGLLNWSATRTEGGVGSVWPTVPVCASPPLSVICDAPPTCAVMLNVTLSRPPVRVAFAVVVS